MSKGLKCLAFCLMMVVGGVLIPAYVSAATIFADVPDGYQGKAEIEYLYNKGIIIGYTDGSMSYFKPNNNVTRAQAAKMLVIALGQSELKVDKATYNDVPTSDYYSGWIERAAALNLISGYQDGSFHPGDNLTRGQMAKIIAIGFHLDSEEMAAKAQAFPDVDKSNDKYNYVNDLYYNGISNGDKGKFNPNQYLTRKQYSLFLARAMDETFKLPIPEEKPVASSAIANGKVTASSLNVRASASASSKIVGNLKLGNIVSVLELNNNWAKILYNGKEAYISKTYIKLMNISGNPIKNRIIILDPGHGGKDPGTSSGGLVEKNITLAVAKKVQQKLQSAGAKVYMTRTGDTYPTLDDRVNFSESHYGELFVSIHVNSGVSSAKGTETFYNIAVNENGKESSYLAKDIQQQMVSVAKMSDRGVKQGDLHVIREQDITSVLVELGFITNSDDASKLNSATYQDKFAQAIYQGVVNYYSQP